MSFGGGQSAPDPDPRIGEAALKSAEIGGKYLDWMKDQSKISNKWALDDRARHQTVFQPLQDEYIARSQEGPDYAGVEQDVDRAAADASLQASQAQAQMDRQLAAQGIDPRSGRSAETMRRSELDEALMTTGVSNQTRLQGRAAAEAESEMMKSNAINMGSGLGVNPATSLGLSNSSMSSGFSGAMKGQGQMMSGLNMQYGQQMDKWRADQEQSNSLWGGIGNIAGLGISMMSSKEYKEDKRPAKGVLDAVRSMPVEEWKYKEGLGDGGAHVGPYAEDFHAATGKGDGKSIPIIDAIGVTMGAVQELDRKMRKGEGRAKGGNADDPGDRRGSGPSPKSIMGAI
jgi:hypothetical protein